MQDVIPMLSYEDGFAAIEWLQHAFGFAENSEMRFIENGRVIHAELSIGDNIIMLATPTPYYESPNKHRKHCEPMNKWLQVPWVISGLLVYTEDVDAHFKRAKENGAEILSEIEEGFPGKRYRCADIEGNRWMFMEKQTTT